MEIYLTSHLEAVLLDLIEIYIPVQPFASLVQLDLILEIYLTSHLEAVLPDHFAPFNQSSGIERVILHLLYTST